MVTDTRPVRRRVRQQPDQETRLPSGAGEATPRNEAARIVLFTVITGESPRVASDTDPRRARTFRDRDKDRTLCTLAVFGGCALFWLSILELCRRLL